MGFWDPALWLPRDVEWHRIPPQFKDLIYPIYLAIPLVIVRILWESFVGVPLGYMLGYYGNKSKLQYLVTDHLFGGFARNSRPKRVLECFWRFSYYLMAFIYGCIVLWDKSWLWDVKECWIGYPFHPVPNSIWWYYTIETSFYYSLLIASAFIDVRRSDFWQLIIHHFVTIGLLATSWTINFVRVGTLVLISHDVADILLEGGKLTRYDRNKKTLTNVAFVVFLIGWIITRLGYYPFILIRSALFEAANLIQPDYDLLDFTEVPYVPRFIILLLTILLGLHVLWTFLIYRVVVKVLTQGAAGDVRSDSDSDSENNVQETRKKLLKKTKKSNDTSTDSDDEDVQKDSHASSRRRRVRRE
ncbi:unnamed protein product [Auanema sp. JU1783]|nr:unnamed protein product [Auanema sp. JU1783]